MRGLVSFGSLPAIVLTSVLFLGTPPASAQTACQNVGSNMYRCVGQYGQVSYEQGEWTRAGSQPPDYQLGYAPAGVGSADGELASGLPAATDGDVQETPGQAYGGTVQTTSNPYVIGQDASGGTVASAPNGYGGYDDTNYQTDTVVRSMRNGYGGYDYTEYGGTGAGLSCRQVNAQGAYTCSAS